MNDDDFTLQYIVASSLYGTLPLSEILPEIARTQSEHIDIWPRVHGDQRAFRSLMQCEHTTTIRLN